ncbi:hypothetical protein ABTK75_19110 [Acinetobacter baumannii]
MRIARVGHEWSVARQFVRRGHGRYRSGKSWVSERHSSRMHLAE